MGNSASAKLGFGIRLGGSEGEWVAGAPLWLTGDFENDLEPVEDPAEEIDQRLKGLPISVGYAGTYDYSEYVLYIKDSYRRVSWGCEDITIPQIEEPWYSALGEALKRLGFPTDSSAPLPSWVLWTFYG